MNGRKGNIWSQVDVTARQEATQSNTMVTAQAWAGKERLSGHAKVPAACCSQGCSGPFQVSKLQRGVSAKQQLLLGLPPAVRHL